MEMTLSIWDMNKSWTCKLKIPFPSSPTKVLVFPFPTTKLQSQILVLPFMDPHRRIFQVAAILSLNFTTRIPQISISIPVTSSKHLRCPEIWPSRILVSPCTDPNRRFFQVSAILPLNFTTRIPQISISIPVTSSKLLHFPGMRVPPFTRILHFFLTQWKWKYPNRLQFPRRGTLNFHSTKRLFQILLLSFIIHREHIPLTVGFLSIPKSSSIFFQPVSSISLLFITTLFFPCKFLRFYHNRK